LWKKNPFNHKGHKVENEFTKGEARIANPRQRSDLKALIANPRQHSDLKARIANPRQRSDLKETINNKQ
jgi:hypothetical protein